MGQWRVVEYHREHNFKSQGELITELKYRYDIAADNKTICSLGSNYEDACLVAAAPLMQQVLEDLALALATQAFSENIRHKYLEITKLALAVAKGKLSQ